MHQVLSSVQVRTFHHAVSERVHSCVAQLAPRVPRPPVVTGYDCSCGKAEAQLLEQVANHLFLDSIILKDLAEDFAAVALPEAEVGAFRLRVVA
eukprot:3234505-Rhodomonas_salina.1